MKEVPPERVEKFVEAVREVIGDDGKVTVSQHSSEDSGVILWSGERGNATKSITKTQLKDPAWGRIVGKDLKEGPKTK
jgi:hypothetical protein